jgi:Flp pilus assembly protein TadG
MRQRRGERGAVTAELALVLPMLVAVTVGLVWLLAVGAAQVRTVDAARETARALARGDDEGGAVERGLEVAPPGSRITVSRNAGDIRVTVTGEVAGPGGLLAHLPSPTLRAESLAVEETTAPAPP